MYLIYITIILLFVVSYALVEPLSRNDVYSSLYYVVVLHQFSLARENGLHRHIFVFLLKVINYDIVLIKTFTILKMMQFLLSFYFVYPPPPQSTKQPKHCLRRFRPQPSEYITTLVAAPKLCIEKKPEIENLFFV